MHRQNSTTHNSPLQTLGAYLEGQGRRIICSSKTGPAFGGDDDGGENAVMLVARVLYIALCARSKERMGAFQALPLERRALIISHARHAIARLEGGVQ